MGLGWDDWDEAEYQASGHNHPFADTFRPGLVRGKVPRCPECDKVSSVPPNYGASLSVPMTDVLLFPDFRPMMTLAEYAAREFERQVIAFLAGERDDPSS